MVQKIRSHILLDPPTQTRDEASSLLCGVSRRWAAMARTGHRSTTRSRLADATRARALTECREPRAPTRAYTGAAKIRARLHARRCTWRRPEETTGRCTRHRQGVSNIRFWGQASSSKQSSCLTGRGADGAATALTHCRNPRRPVTTRRPPGGPRQFPRSQAATVVLAPKRRSWSADAASAL